MSERPKAKSYAAEFKESAVKLAVESGRPMAQTARELGVSQDTLYGWVRQSHGKAPPGREAAQPEPLSEEVKRLRREVSILKEERDILKNRLRGFSRALCIETGSRLHSWHARTVAARFLEALPRQKTWPRGSCGPNCGGTIE